MAHVDLLRERVRLGFEAARAAREAHDGPARLAALEDAWGAAVELGDPTQRAAACWRLAKARYDEHVDDRLVEALEPLADPTLRARTMWGTRERVGPFDHYEAGLAALEPVARRHWDRLGYRVGADVLDVLWDAWLALREERGERFLVAWGHVQRAWPLACTGRLAELTAVQRHHASLRPRAFDASVHRHARAQDAPGSVAWLQVDLARTLLTAATWGGDEATAAMALEHLEDAAEDAELVREADFWFLDPVLRAAERFGWDAPVAQYAEAYARHAGDGAAGPREPHRLRAAAWLARREGAGVEASVRAAEACAAAVVGSEWVVEAWLEAAEAAGDQGEPHRARAREEAARTGVVMDRL